MMKKIIFIYFFFFINCEGPIFDVPNDKDTIPPTLTITYPADKSIVSDTVLITAYAFDNVELDTVQIFLNDSVIHSSKEPPFSYQWITNDYQEDASHTIRAKAIDLQGNINFTNTISVTVDNVDNSPPTGAIIFPFTGQTLNGEVTIVIEASDNEEVASLILYIDGNVVQTFTDQPYRFTWNTTGLVDDIVYTIHAHVIDNNSNQITLGPINVLIDNEEPTDNIPPTGTITNPASAASVSGNVNIDINAFDNTAVKYVDIIIDGSLVDTDSILPYSYNWNTLNEIEDVHHVINVNITDLSGNTTTLFPVSVFVNNSIDPDNTPPTIIITEPAANQTVNGTVNIKTLVFDNIGISRVEFYQNYDIVHTASSNPYEYSWNTSVHSDESQHIWYVKAFDTSENSSQSQPLAVTIDNIDNIPPSGYISFPYAGQSVSGEIEIQLSTNDNIAVTEAKFFINGNLVFTDNIEPFSYSWNTLLEEENSETVIFSSISDNANNIVDLNPIVVFVDNDDIIEDDNIYPFASIISPISSQIVSDTVLISGFATDNVGIEEIKYFINGNLFETLIDTPYATKWNTYSYPNNSNHTITMIANDPAGNEYISQPVYVIVQNEYESIVSDIYLESSIDTFKLNWDAPFGAERYKIYRDGTFIEEVTEQFLVHSTPGGVEHCFEISAVNSVNIEGEKSEQICGVAILNSPSSFNVNLNYEDIELNWSSVTNASGYQLRRNDLIIWTGNNLNYTDNNINFDTIYSYTINAFDFQDTAGALSNIISVLTVPEILPPILASSITGTSATLNWTSIETAQTYRIYKDDSFLTETDALTYEIDILPGIQSCFKITSINTLGAESIFSNEECQTGS